MHRPLARAILAFLFVPLAGAPGASADFGSGGIVYTTIGSQAAANALVLQPDGTLVAAGYSDSGFALAKYLSDGALDTSFGAGGVVVTPSSPYIVAYALLRQPDGKLVAAGNGGGFVLARYTANGSLDTGFGTGGTTTTAIGLEANARSLVYQPDGKLVAAGDSWTGTQHNFTLARYNPDGSLDIGFGTAGVAATPVAAYDNQIQSLVYQPDGKLVAAGYAVAGGPAKFAVARYLGDGTFDAGFGTGGVTTTAITGIDDRVYSLILQPDGKLVAGGYAYINSKQNFALARYNPDGSLDSSFGASGTTLTSIGGFLDCIYALALQPDGKVVAAGFAGNYGFESTSALARYNSDGSLDTTFGTGGIVVTSGIAAHSLVRQADGKLVVAGSGAFTYFALARYHGDGTLDVPLPTPTATPAGPTPTPTRAPPPALSAGTFKVFYSRINPLRGETCSIVWAQPDSGPVSLKILDINGREMRVLADQQWFAGQATHAVSWDGRDAHGQPLASGIYIARLTAGSFKAFSKVAITK